MTLGTTFAAEKLNLKLVTAHVALLSEGDAIAPVRQSSNPLFRSSQGEWQVLSSRRRATFFLFNIKQIIASCSREVRYFGNSS